MKLAYTTEEAAQILSIGHSKCKELVARGQIRSFQIPGEGKRKLRRISHQALQDFIQRQEGAETGGISFQHPINN